jgi:hypothetical protein
VTIIIQQKDHCDEQKICYTYKWWDLWNHVVKCTEQELYLFIIFWRVWYASFPSCLYHTQRAWNGAGLQQQGKYVHYNKENQMQIRVPHGTRNYVNELLAYPSLYGRRISDLSSWARIESHIASIVVVKSIVLKLKVTRLKNLLQCFCPCMYLPPSYRQKKLNLIDTMIQLNVHTWGRSPHTLSTRTRFGHLGRKHCKSQTIPWTSLTVPCPLHDRNICPGILHQSGTPFGLSTTHSELVFLSAICGPDSDALEIDLT